MFPGRWKDENLLGATGIETGKGPGNILGVLLRSKTRIPISSGNSPSIFGVVHGGW